MKCDECGSTARHDKDCSQRVVTKDDLNRLMAKVQMLLSKADATDFPDEATTYRAKAEGLMREYRLDEEHLIAVDHVEILPEVHTMWLGPTHDDTRARGKRSYGKSYYDEWYRIACGAAFHAGVRVYCRFGRNPETGEYGIFAVFVGYSGDLRLAEIIYTAARIVFGDRVEPKIDPALSDQVNCYRLRSAGITRERISILLWGKVANVLSAKVGTLYKKECAERGEAPVLDGRGINAALYRDQFASAFVDELNTRLRQARDVADSIGGRMTLHGREERITEAFYQEFPELRPVPRTEVAEVSKEVEEPKKKGRVRKPYWDTVAGQKAAERFSSDVAIAARSAGKAAARDVELDRNEPIKRVSKAPRSATGAIEG